MTHLQGLTSVSLAEPTSTTDTGARSRTRRARPWLGLGSVVLIEVILAVGVIVWILVGSWGASAMAVAAMASLCVVPLGDGGSVAQRLGRRLSFLWHRWRHNSADLAPAPFDIPVAGTGRAHLSSQSAGVVGARWAGRTLITVLRVEPGENAPTYLTAGAVEPAVDTGQLIPVQVLAECISPYDIRLRSIDVISHGRRTWGSSPLTAIYARTVGPLPAMAARSVFVVLRLNPLDCADAVARRGGGATGALRTSTIATRRVAERLAEHGLRVTILSAADIDGAATQLLDGADLGSAAEEWESVRFGNLRMRTAAVDPAELEPTLRAVTMDSAVSTTVTIRLARTEGDDLQIRGFVRLNEFAGTDSGRVLPSTMRSLNGRQFDALALSLPLASPSRMDRNIPSLSGSQAEEVLRSLQIPAAGCGQVVGADRTGRAVAIRLAGPDVPAVTVAADLALLTQLVLRAISVGIAVVVHTQRPRRWAPAIGAVGDLGLLSLAADRAWPRAPLQMVVVDGVPRPSVPAGTTILTVLAPGTGAEHPTDDSVVLLRQNPRTPQQISVTTASTEVHVTMVAIREEWQLIGGHEAPDTRPRRARVRV